MSTVTTTTGASAGQERQFADRIVQLLQHYMVRRIFQAILTVWAVLSFTFFLIRLMPGNPVDVYITELMGTQAMSYEEARDMAISLFAFDPNAPLGEQYLAYMSNLMRGDLGNSIQSPAIPVTEILARFLPWTLFSVGVSLLLSFTLGVLLGMTIAYMRDTALDHILTGIGSFLSSVPNYLIAILILVVAGVQWGWFRVSDVIGGYTPGMKAGFTVEYILDIFKHALLLVVTYVLSTVGGWMLTMKGSTISTLGEDYVNVARARGLSTRRIVTAYVGRNAMLPLFTSLAISVGFVVGGSVIIESIFQYPGVGRRLLEAITRRDYTMMQGVFLVITIAVVVSNILADLLYSILDPRIRVQGE